MGEGAIILHFAVPEYLQGTAALLNPDAKGNGLSSGDGSQRVGKVSGVRIGA